VASNDSLIREIAVRQPGTVASLQILRDGRSMTIPVKLAERPPRGPRGRDSQREDDPSPQPSSQRGPSLGVSVRNMDREFGTRFKIPADVQGVIVSRVEPMSPAFDADIERGHVVLEINRQPVRTIEDFRRLTAGARAGDVLAFYLYKPEIEQRALHTVRIDER
jgi:serine protease Do